MNDEKVENLKSSLTTDQHTNFACSIIKSAAGTKHTEETVVYIKNIVKYLEKHAGMQFQSMTADFIKDENERWYMIGIESY